MTVTLASSSSSADYRRQARKIRASFHGDSFLTQQAIGELAKRRDLELQASDSPNPASAKDPRRATLHLEISAVVERGFSAHAASKLQPFGFTYSDRVSLLDAGEKLGISRFRANMILAMLENQRSVPRQTVKGIDRKPAVPSLLLVLALEAFLVASIVWFYVT